MASQREDKMNELGVEVCEFDQSLFFAYYRGELTGIICIYVDDFLWARNDWFEKNVVNKLKEEVLIGSSSSATFRYVGMNINTSIEGIDVHHCPYISSLQPISVSRARSFQSNNALSETEKDSYRMFVGQLNWVSTNTRPDIAYDVCELSSAFKHATVRDISKMNKLVERLQKDALWLHFPRLKNTQRCSLEVFFDASIANLGDGGSQGAFIVFLKDD